MLTLVIIASLVRGPADVESLTAASDAVVHAQVVKRTSGWGRGGGQIFTTVVLRTIETWKGEPAAQVTVTVPGGDAGEYTQTVHGEAVFQDGEEVVVFLRKRAPGVFGVERLGLGKFSVAAASAGVKRAARDRTEIECVGCKTGEPDVLSLDELRARVLRSVAK